jgi:hypothetical protein
MTATFVCNIIDKSCNIYSSLLFTLFSVRKLTYINSWVLTFETLNQDVLNIVL